MHFTETQISQLSAKLDGSAVKERSQAGRKLSYVESWHAIAEANRIFGFDGWSSETVDIRTTNEGPTKIGNDKKDGWRVGYFARVRLTVYAGDRVILRDGCGWGSGIDMDLGQAHESALKEAESDARKRGLMTFGNPFGLALYDKTQAEVDRTPAERPQKVGAPPPTNGLGSNGTGGAASGGTNGSGKKRLAGFFDRPSYTISWPESTDKKSLTIEEQCASWLGHWTAVIDKLDAADEWMKLSVDNADMLQMLKRGAEKMHVAAVSAHKEAGKKFDPNRIPLVGG